MPEGDYTFEGFEDVFAVERKSLDDLAKSLGADRDRFEDEIQRAQRLYEFAVVIEAHRTEVSQYAGTKNCPNYYSGIYPNSILGTVDQWPQKYSTLDFYWCGNREGAKQKTLELLAKWYALYRSKRQS
jgi:hypothetical protein